MNTSRLQLITLTMIFAIATLVVALMWWPYLTILAIGVILSILFFPIYEKIKNKINNESVSAILTLFVVLLIVIVPLYIIGQLLFNEIIGIYGNYKQGGFQINQSVFIENLPGQAQEVVKNFLGDLGAKISSFAGNAFQGISGILSNVAGFFLSFFLVFFTLYYLLKDGQKIRNFINSILPLSAEHENLLVAKLESAISGVVKGAFLVALIQGLVATVGFLIFGVPSAFLWGSFTVLAALVPNVGTSLSIIPAVVYLFITGHVGAGIGMIIWGAAAVGTIDNIISPKLIGRQAQIHPLLVLFSVLGGLHVFGFLGFLLGPIIMSIFVTLLDIYREDLKGYFKK